MRTYNDLLAVGDNDFNRAEFCVEAINIFRCSPEYLEAQAGNAYYAKHNLTIEKYQKVLRTLSGREVKDTFSANYRIKTTFFPRLIHQIVQYTLGNGLKLSEPSDKDKLGKDFDYQLQNATKIAMAQGRAFGFWNYDHLEVFGFADSPSQPGFCPLYSEETSQLMGGIRFWYKLIGTEMILRFTLYEPDGITEFRKKGSENCVILKSKHGYITTVHRTEINDVEEIIEENYPTLPIIPLYANDTHQSELNGVREAFDCYDFVKSGLANDIDDTSGFYWILKNEGGMDDVDLAKFIHRMKTVRAAVIDGDDANVEAHTMDIPVDARMRMLEVLRKDIYEDFEVLDVSTLSAAAKTTQEIQAAYQAQDNKCADLEYLILDFVRNILELAGITSTPSLMWNKVINKQEQTAMVISAANYVSQECIISHLPWLTPDEVQQEIERMDMADYQSFNNTEEDENEAE